MRSDPYPELDFTDIASPVSADIADAASPDRREFLKVLGGGVLVFVALGEADALGQAARGGRGGGGGGGGGGRGGFGGALPSDLNAFLKIGEDGRVSCFTGKIEMGQGIVTSLAQMLADELAVPLDRVDMVLGDTDLCPYDMGTFGSMSTRFFGPALRAAAAEAREVLVQLAAERLKVPAAELVVKDGAIVQKKDGGQRVSFADLTKGKRIERKVNQKAVLKSAADFTLVGKPVVRTDGRDKVTGKAKYAADIRVPGMLCAKILRPPAHGATLKSVSTAEAEKIPGVRVVRQGELVAVLHEHPDVAEDALRKVAAQFDVPTATVDDQTIFDHLLKVAPPGRSMASGGDLAQGEKLSVKKAESTYLNAYVAHAPMEPHAALAKFDGGKLTVWASTQNPFGLKGEVAQAVGLSAENVRVITPFVGGGFGGKTNNQQAVEAATLAKAAGCPVQVAWSRSEEFFYDAFRPAAIVKIRSGVDGAGKLVFWDYHVYYAGERGCEQFYDVPHHATVSHGSGWTGGPGTHPFRTGAWRAPGNNTNTFARESQIDIMARAAGADPVEFRLKNLKDARMIRVLKAAAEKFGWPAKKPAGRPGVGFGVACGQDAGAYVAFMAEVEVRGARVQVNRVVCAQDMGLVINPEGAKIQIEGGITMGLGYTLAEAIRFKGGDVLDRSFQSYRIPRFSWLPRIETVLIDAKDAPAEGGGEPAIIGTGAVIANAVFDATGQRPMNLPIRLTGGGV